jgi:hypothetical protein
MKHQGILRVSPLQVTLFAALALFVAAAGTAQALPAPVIVDNTDPGFSASDNWGTTAIVPGYYGTNYRYRPCAPVNDPATWAYAVPTTANYKIYAWWPQWYAHASTAPYIVYHSGGSTTVWVNQQVNGAQWNLLGTFALDGGENRIQLSCWVYTSGYVVIADAVKISR